MRKSALCMLSVVLLLFAAASHARDTKHHFPLSDALNTADSKAKLTDGVGFYFGDQAHPAVEQRFGESYTNKKTNAFNKTDKEACEWAFLSAMLQLQEKAQQLGANAVVNIESYYKKVVFSSPTEYECHVGAIIAGVALKGEFVTLAK